MTDKAKGYTVVDRRAASNMPPEPPKPTTSIKDLLQSLTERWAPEQVVKIVLDLGPADEGKGFDNRERALLLQALPRWGMSSMPTVFERVKGFDRQMKVASDLFPDVKQPKLLSPENISEYVERLRSSMLMTGNDFKANRLNHEARKKRAAKSAGVPQGSHAYNKRFRFLARMAEHMTTRAATAEMKELAQIAKSRLASKIDTDQIKDLGTASFVAYMAAKLNKRSIFTFDKQEAVYDEVAEVLFRRLGRRSNWLMVAYVHPAPEVLIHLSDAEKGQLLGAWFDIMVRAARVLEREEKGGGLDLRQMIVRSGNDSSTWNEAAGAFTKARDGWINTLYSLGMQDVLDTFVPGKALRLMAADVAWGHRTFGSGLDPDTTVWNELPKPWEVILHEVPCTRTMVEDACRTAGVKGKGWLAPREKTIAEFKPTPELVHGVVISCPDLAHRLKRVGYFGGPSKGGAKTFVPISKTLDGKTVKVDYARGEVDRDDR